MRVFMGKHFAHWAKDERIENNTFCEAAKEIIAGQVEADLGKNLYKKRVKKEGMGKRGGYRVIVAYKKPNSNRIFFISSFAKNEQGTLKPKEQDALSKVAKSYVDASDSLVDELKAKGSIIEICGGKSHE